MADGSRMEGNFLNGELNGRGTAFLPDGSRMEGNSLNGELNGRGTAFLPDGLRMEGSFLNGELNGRGTVFLPDGSRMEGNFIDNELGGWRFSFRMGLIFRVRSATENSAGMYLSIHLTASPAPHTSSAAISKRCWGAVICEDGLRKHGIRPGSLPKPSDSGEAVLLEERTRESGWKARHEPTGLQGPIQNSEHIHTIAEPGQRVSPIVASTNRKEMAFS